MVFQPMREEVYSYLCLRLHFWQVFFPYIFAGKRYLDIIIQLYLESCHGRTLFLLPL